MDPVEEALLLCNQQVQQKLVEYLKDFSDSDNPRFIADNFHLKAQSLIEEFVKTPEMDDLAGECETVCIFRNFLMEQYRYSYYGISNDAIGVSMKRSLNGQIYNGYFMDAVDSPENLKKAMQEVLKHRPRYDDNCLIEDLVQNSKDQYLQNMNDLLDTPDLEAVIPVFKNTMKLS